MAGKDPKSLTDLLHCGALGELTAEAQRRRGLTQRIRALLPADEAAHLVSASTDSEGELVLVMDASVWAARVRYYAKRLGRDRIAVKVVPRSDQPE